MGRGSSSVASGNTDTRNRKGPETPLLGEIGSHLKEWANRGKDRTAQMGVQMANIYGISMAVSDMISKRKVANLFADPSFQQVMSIVEDNMGRTSAFSRLGTYRRIREGQGVGGRSTREAVVSAVNDLKKRGYSTNEIEGALHYHELLLEGIWNTRGANSARFLD